MNLLLKPKYQAYDDDVWNRFVLKIDVTSNCWNWKAGKGAQGYGSLRVTDKYSTMIKAHRMSYEFFVGKIPKDKVIDHLCRNRSCVNPEHLEVVSSRENTLRGETLASKEAKQTSCIRGHELKGNNLAFRTDGKRACKTCNVNYCRKYRQNKQKALGFNWR